MTKHSPFRYFKTSPEIIRLALMLYVRFPLSLRNVEDLLHERGVEISHETVRFWWNRFGQMFAAEIRRNRVSRMRSYSNWQWYLDEAFVKINGEMHYLWRELDHEGEVLVGNKFLHAGPGYGGSCFPKDTKALARIGQEHAVPMQITETVIKVNEEIKRRMVEKLLTLCDGSFNGKTIAVLGVTFKPNTDDMREAPSLTIVPALVGAGAKVVVTDPQGKHEGETLLPGVVWVEDAYKAVQRADLCVLLTEWNEFRALDLNRIARRMNTPRFADLRNVYSEKDLKRAGFESYAFVGR